MGRLGQGDTDALNVLMERHHGRVYRIALSYLRNPDDALDVVQETFVKLFQNGWRWRGESEFGPWLTRIAVNQSIDQFRKGKRRRTREEPLEPEEQRAADPSPEGSAASQELGDRIGRAVRTLPERQRAVFVLRHYDEMSLPEIATSLGLNIGTVKSNLHRALARLRDRLEGVHR